jgi:hypothetical protein
MLPQISHYRSFKDQSGKKIPPMNHAFLDAEVFKQRLVQDKCFIRLIFRHKTMERFADNRPG